MLWSSPQKHNPELENTACLVSMEPNITIPLHHTYFRRVPHLILSPFLWTILLDLDINITIGLLPATHISEFIYDAMFNSLKASDGFMCQWTRLPLVREMACSIISHYLKQFWLVLHTWRWTRASFKPKYRTFLPRKMDFHVSPARGR